MKTCYLYLFSLFFLSPALIAQDGFDVAARETFSFDKEQKQFSILHFRFTFLPDYSANQFTGVFYRIDYNEVGTESTYRWVRLGDGHLINLRNVEKQWKGPFVGIKSIWYKFHIGLESLNFSEREKTIAVTIFSTNPKFDSTHFHAYNSAPFDVQVSYYDASGLKQVLYVYEAVSKVNTVFEIATKLVKGGGIPWTMVASEIVEAGIIYIVDLGIESYEAQPLTFDIRCNACKRHHSLVRSDRSDFIFRCQNENCAMTANISFSH
jgi:hypothetical protein